MTLPKAISDAIDLFARLSNAPTEGTRASARANLELTIVQHVAPVAAPIVPGNRPHGADWMETAMCGMPAFDSPEFPAAYKALIESAPEAFAEPVAAPTEAEIEAWKVCAMGWSIDKAKEPPILQPQPDDVGKDGEAFLVVRSEIEEAIALMRRAAAAKKLMECQFGDIGSSKHARYEVYTTPVLGWSVGEPLPNLSVEVDGKVTRYVPEKQGGK